MFVCGDCDVIHHRCTITLMAEVVAAVFAHVPVIGLRFSMLLLEEGEEGEVSKRMPQGGVLVPAVWAGEAIKMVVVVVTTAEQEAVVSISVLYNRAKRLSGNGSVERKNRSACI